MGTIETYQTAVLSEARRMIRLADAAFTDGGPTAAPPCEQTNDEIAAMLRKKTDETLEKVLFTASCNMKISFSREDV
jgi:dipeptidase